MSPLQYSLVFLFLFASNNFATAFDYANTPKRVSDFRLARIHKHLQKINKTPVKSIESPDGDVIDCIDHKDQPALDHPLLKNHRVQMVAPPRPNSDTTVEAAEVGAWQDWSRAGHCPEGTIPIWRSTVDSILRAKSLYHYGKKLGNMSATKTTERSTDAPDIISKKNHEHAVAYTNAEEIYGAKATMTVWNPSIEEATEFSLSQIWLVSGSFGAADLNTIEAGWQVHPGLFGDSNPRLFVYWTRDSYQTTGCYNLLCPGFIQTSKKVAIGAAISPVSSYSGDQYEISILIWKDPELGHWWLSFEGEPVGYWPAEIFTHLADHGTTVEWGGEVVNTRASGRHTSTQMGSGHFAEEGHGRASYFRNLQTVDSDNSLIAVQSVATAVDNSNCYDIKIFGNKHWGTHFYFGGPGFNPKCP